MNLKNIKLFSHNKQERAQQIGVIATSGIFIISFVLCYIKFGRNIGVALGYATLAYTSLMTGLNKLELNEERLQEDLDNAWEVLAEPIQTVMRRYGVAGAYEKLKEVTRGKTVLAADLHNLINGLEIPQADKDRLLAMTPASYIGKAAELARRV